MTYDETQFSHYQIDYGIDKMGTYVTVDCTLPSKTRAKIAYEFIDSDNKQLYAVDVNGNTSMPIMSKTTARSE